MHKLLVLLAHVLASAAFAQPPKLVSAARQQTRSHVVYDGRYVRIGYTMGDVPSTRGVCTDVVIRAYRTSVGAAIDLTTARVVGRRAAGRRRCGVAA